MTAIRDALVATLCHQHDPFDQPELEVVQAKCAPRLDASHCLAETMAGLRPKVVVDIGAGEGSATIQMAALLRDYGIDGVVIAVDTWLGSYANWYDEARPDAWQKFVSHINEHGMRKYVLPMRLDDANAVEVMSRFSLVIDVMHISAGGGRNLAISSIH